MKNENGDIIHFIKEKKEMNCDNDNNLNYSNNYLGLTFENNIDENEINNLKIQFNLFKKVVYCKLKKKEYKTVLKLIEDKYNYFIILHEEEELIFLKIDILFKIIKNKCKKYYNQNIENSLIIITKEIKNNTDKKNLNEIYNKKIDKYYLKIINELNKIIEEIPYVYQNIQILFIEKIIQIYLQLLIHKIIQKELLNQIHFIIYYLSLGEKLIFNFHDYIKDIKTLSLCQEIFLRIAKLYFINKEFENVEKYSIKCIDYCFRELIFKFGDLRKIIFPKKKIEKKSFLHLSFSLIYLGFCKEEKGEISYSYKYYYLAEIISKNYLYEDYKFFITFINNLRIRAEEYKIDLNLLKKEEEEKLKITKKKEEKAKIIKEKEEKVKNENEKKIEKKIKEEKEVKFKLERKKNKIKLNNKISEEYFFSLKLLKKHYHEHYLPNSELSSKNSKLNFENEDDSKFIEKIHKMEKYEKKKIKEKIKNILFNHEKMNINKLTHLNRKCYINSNQKKNCLTSFLNSQNNLKSFKILKEIKRRNSSNENSEQNCFEKKKINNSINRYFRLKKICSCSNLSENESNQTSNNVNLMKINIKKEKNCKLSEIKKRKNKSYDIKKKINLSNFFIVKKLNLNKESDREMLWSNLLYSKMENQNKNILESKNFNFLYSHYSFSEEKNQIRNALCLNEEKNIKNNFIKNKFPHIDILRHFNNTTRNLNSNRFLSIIKSEDKVKSILKFNNYDIKE